MHEPRIARTPTSQSGTRTGRAPRRLGRLVVAVTPLVASVVVAGPALAWPTMSG